jgi:predicted AAA+ superfamily ATPase
MDSLYGMNNSVRFDDVIAYIQNLLRQTHPESEIKDPHVAVLRAAWENLQYDELTLYCTYNDGYLRRVASALFKLLTTVIGTKITKHNFRDVLEEIYQAQFGVVAFNASSVKQTIFGQPPFISNFFGRQAEIRLISKSIEKKCICLTGARGIGKTSLAGKIFQQVRVIKQFDVSIWHYSNSESVSIDMADLLNSVNGTKSQNPINSFFEYLKQNKALIVIDGIDGWLRNLKESEKFLKKLVEVDHASLIFLTCNGSIDILQYLESNKRAVLNIKVESLPNEEAKKILSEYELNEGDLDKFVGSFEGNPYLIHRACLRVKNLYSGNIEDFNSKTSYAGILFRPDYESIFEDPTSRIGNIERSILGLLSMLKDEFPITPKRIVSELEKQSQYSCSEIENSIEILRNHSLINFRTDNESVRISIPRYFVKYIRRNPDIFLPKFIQEKIS